MTFVSNLFCDGWSAKFILRWLECKIYFAMAGVQNLFCDGLHSIVGKMNFALQFGSYLRNFS